MTSEGFTDRIGAHSISLGILALLVGLFIPVSIFNHAIFQSINNLHSSPSDVIWLGLTTLGDGLILTVILGAFLVKNPRVTVLGVVLLLVSAVGVHTLKVIFAVPRPAAVLQGVHVLGPLLRSDSFPSGHTASVMCASLAVAHFCRSWATGITVVIAGALVGLSRIFVGAHFPTDVLGGTILAVGLFIVVTGLARTRLEELIPARPMFSIRFFRIVFWIEVLLAGFAGTIWAWYAAELPIMATAGGITVLVVLWSGYHNRPISDPNPSSAL